MLIPVHKLIFFIQWRGNIFLTEGRGAENLNFVFPQIAKHLHQPEMFNGSRVLHIL